MIITALILAFFVYIPFHPFLTAWLGSLTEVYAPIKIWKDVAIAVTASGLVVYSVLKPDLRKLVWTDIINLLILTYVSLHFLLAVLFGSFFTESTIAGLIFNLRFLALFISIRILMLDNPGLVKRIRPGLIRIFVTTTLIVGVIAVIQVIVPSKGIYESFGYDGVNTIAPATYVDDRIDSPRAFSTLRGPNELGAYMILPVSIATAGLIAFRRKGLYITLLLLAMAAIIASYSRSALIGALVAIGTVVVFLLARKISKKTRITIFLAALLAAGLLLWSSIVVPQIRLYVFHSSPGDPSLFEGSTADHLLATSQGINDVLDHPFGRGPGEAGPASFYQTDEPPRIAENYYVQVAQEVGVIGLGIFIAIAILVIKRLLIQKDDIQSLALLASFAGLTTVGLFLHVWNDDPVSYAWWGLAAFTIGYNERQQWIRSKNSSHSKTS